MSKFENGLKKILGSWSSPIEKDQSTGSYNTWTDPSNGNVYTMGPNGIGILSSQPISLSKEEVKELTELEREQAQILKKGKLDIFKKLAPSLRQTIVTSFMWTKAVEDMNTLLVSPSGRLQELRNKEIIFSGRVPVLPQNYPYSNGTSWQGIKLSHHSFTIPNGLTAEDLIQAHLEVSVEEELTDDAQS